MNKLRKLGLAIALVIGCTQVFAASSILVSEAGGDDPLIKTVIFNGSSYDITKLVFDFSNTTTTDGSHLIIDGSPFAFTAPAGSDIDFTGAGSSVFEFTFDSFNQYETFVFQWDPDSAVSGAYEATALDFIGGIVTAYTTNGLYQGVFARVGTTPDVSAALSPYIVPVPEPLTSSALLAGLGVLAIARRRYA